MTKREKDVPVDVWAALGAALQQLREWERGNNPHHVMENSRAVRQHIQEVRARHRGKE